MSCLIVVASRGMQENEFEDLTGRSLFERVPGRVVLFSGTDNGRAHGPNVTVETIEYMQPDALLERAAHYRQSHGATGISTLDERAVDTVAWLRESLDMPGARPAGAKLFRDKVVMKERVAGSGLRVPAWCPASDVERAVELLERCGRVVLKPRDGQGSRQISFHDSADGLRDGLRAIRNPDAFEVEEYIEGHLYHTNSIVIGGQVRFTAVAQYLPGMGNIDFGTGAPFACFMEPEGDLQERLRRFSVAAIEALGMSDGVTHMEIFVTADGELVFCETAMRPGGGGIVHMIEAQCGVNLSLATLLIDAGCRDLALQDVAGHEGELAGLVGLRNVGMGSVALHDLDHSTFEPWLTRLDLYVRDGQYRPPSSHCTDFTALAILCASGIEQFRERIHMLTDHIEQRLRLV